MEKPSIMIKVFYCISLSIVITSCSHIYFTEPQPRGGIPLFEIPNELHGVWSDQNGGIEIHKYGYNEFKYELDSVTNSFDTLIKYMNLSDSFKLFRAKELYVFNAKLKSKYWEIAILTKQKNGDIHYYVTSEPDVFVKDRNLKLIEAKYNIDDEEKIIKTINPDFEDHISFKYAIFSGQMKYKTLRKIITNENLMQVYKKNGTFFSPSDTMKIY